MRVDTRDLIARYIYLFGVWEPYTTKVLQLTLGEGDVLLDVGAHVGYFSLLGAQLVGPSGAVVSVEPNPDAVAELRENLALNRCGNVEVAACAVHERQQRVQFWTPTPESNSGSATMIRDRCRTRTEPDFEAEAKPLRSLLRPSVRRRVKVVKIDVEGAEVAVLGSLIEILPEMRPDVVVLMELSPETSRAEAAMIHRRMGGLGFAAYRLHNEYGVSSYPRMISDRRVAMSEFDPGDTRDVEVDLMFVPLRYPLRSVL